MTSGQADQDRAELARVQAELRERWPESRLDPSLDRIRALVDLLGDPQRGYPVIHVGGTNGKTTTARMIDAVLRGFGLRVGRFTSPHLSSVTERISLDGEPISAAPVRGGLRRHPALPDAGGQGPADPAVVLRGADRDGLRRLRRRAGRRGRGRGRHGRCLGLHQRRGRPGRGGHARRRSTTRHTSATRSSRSRWRRRGSSSPASVAVLATQPPAAAEVLLRRVAEVGATVAREGSEFGVAARSVAVGGQVLTVQGLGGVYDELFLPLHGAHQARERRGRAGGGRGVPRRRGGHRGDRRRGGPRGAARRQLARPAGGAAQRADGAGGRGAQPARDGGDAWPRWRSRSRSAG